jgi:hypothetical protein
MPLFEMADHEFKLLPQTSFSTLGVKERSDLQRLLRTQIKVLGEELYVISEEFSDWEDSKRRIDLLAIDKMANLVVIEIKRTSDGGHMELQAIRYASMVSTMTFERAEQIHAKFLSETGQSGELARSGILEFLGWDEPDSDSFASDVRIILVSEDFGKELTTAVLWLRDRDIDIRCIRLRPYQKDSLKLVDVQQIIPLPEAQEYQVKLREKEQQVRRNKAEQYNERLKFWEGLLAIAKARKTRHANIKPSEQPSIGASSGINKVELNYVIAQESARVELYIDRNDTQKNKEIFDTLFSKRDVIERDFGSGLIWERLDDKRACRIKAMINSGGYKSPESEWPAIQTEMVEKMIRLEAALKGPIDGLKL